MKKALALVLSLCMLLAAAPAFALDLLSGRRHLSANHG